jgi:hypothetical protein
MLTSIVYWHSLANKRDQFNQNYWGKWEDGGYREEAESKPPIVKSWRDTEDTLCRQNHQEKAKL